MSHAPAPALPGIFAGRSLGLAVTRLAWPITVENLFQSAILLIDLVLVARLGTVAVAGVGTASQIVWLALGAGAAVGIGATILVAQAVGRNDLPAANHVTRQAILLGVALGAGVALLAPFTEFFIAALGPEPEVVRIGAEYLRVVLFGFVLLVLMMIGSACLRGAGDSRTPMVVTGLVTLVHAGAATVLMYGIGGWEGLGTVGSAWAAAVARGVGAAVLLGLLVQGHRRLAIAGGSWRPDPGVMRRLLTMGLPAAMEQILLSFGFLLYSAMVIPLGTAAFATQRISFQLMSLSFMPGMGYGMAATTLTGQAIGARRPDLARRASYIATGQAAVIMGLGAVLFFFGGEWLMGFFSSDPEIIALGGIGLKVLAISQPFWALGQVMSGSLRGGGETRFPMWSTMAGMWLLRLPIGYAVGILAGFGLPGVYVSSIFDAIFRASLNFARFQRAPWLKTPAAPVAAPSAADD